MAVPAQIEKQSEDVRKLYDDIYGNVDPEGESSEEQPNNEEQPNKIVDSDEPFEQKWRTLQGMYDKANSELNRTRAENVELNTRLSSVEQLLHTVNNPAIPKVETVQPVKIVTDKDIEDYGNDTIAVMRRVSQEQSADTNSKIDEIRRSIENLQGMGNDVRQVVDMQANTMGKVFFGELETLVPNWREVNDSQDFQNWLLETDQLSGMTRQSYLEDAQRNSDARRVAGFFNVWANKSGNNKQSQETKPISQMDAQIAPGRGRAAAAPNPSGEKPTYTKSDIEGFYKDITSGKYTGREKEQGQIERDIFKAGVEGRIT